MAGNIGVVILGVAICSLAALLTRQVVRRVSARRYSKHEPDGPTTASESLRQASIDRYARLCALIDGLNLAMEQSGDPAWIDAHRQVAGESAAFAVKLSDTMATADWQTGLSAASLARLKMLLREADLWLGRLQAVAEPHRTGKSANRRAGQRIAPVLADAELIHGRIR